MKNYIKVGGILIAVLTVYSICIYIIAAKRNNKQNEESKQNNSSEIEKDKNSNNNPISTPNDIELDGDLNIIITPNTKIAYSLGMWQENPNFKHNNMLFDIYVDGQKYQNKYLSYDGNWHIFDNNKNFLDYDGNFLAVNAKKEYKNINFFSSELNESDKNNITLFLNEKGITYNYDELSKTKVIFDLNKDGVRDEIYFVSNAFVENQLSYNKAFTIGFVKYYHKNEVFLEIVDNLENIYDIPNSYLQNILEIDGQTYFIVGNQYFSDNGVYHSIYRYVDTSLIEVLKTSANN